MEENEQGFERSQVFGLILGAGMLALGAVIVASALRKGGCGCEDETEVAAAAQAPDEVDPPAEEGEKWPDPVTEAEQVIAGD